MHRARALFRLQTVESDIVQKERRLLEVEAALGESDALRRARSEVEAVRKRVKDLSARIHLLELESQSIQDEITETEGRLYSGRITNPKELASLAEKARNLKDRRAALEDELLQMMVDNEEAGADLAKNVEALTQVESDWGADQSDLVAERGQLVALIDRLRAERDALRNSIPGEDQELYEDLRKRKGGQGVAKVVDGACQGCGVAVPPAMLSAAARGEELLCCGSCERILYKER